MKKFFFYITLFTLIPITMIGVIIALFIAKMSAISILLSVSYYLLTLLLPIILPIFIIFIIFSIPKLLNRFSGIASFIYLIDILTFIAMVFVFYLFILTPAINLNYTTINMRRIWTALILVSFFINLSFCMVNAFFAKIAFNSLKARVQDTLKS